MLRLAALFRIANWFARLAIVVYLILAIFDGRPWSHFWISLGLAIVFNIIAVACTNADRNRALYPKPLRGRNVSKLGFKV